MQGNPRLLAPLNRVYALAADRGAGVAATPDGVFLVETAPDGRTTRRRLGDSLTIAQRALEAEAEQMRVHAARDLYHA